jgi:hypothetical protein
MEEPSGRLLEVDSVEFLIPLVPGGPQLNSTVAPRETSETRTPAADQPISDLMLPIEDSLLGSLGMELGDLEYGQAQVQRDDESFTALPTADHQQAVDRFFELLSQSRSSLKTYED